MPNLFIYLFINVCWNKRDSVIFFSGIILISTSYTLWHASICWSLCWVEVGSSFGIWTLTRVYRK